MISRREVVTAGVLSSLTGTAATANASQSSQDDSQTRAVLNRMVAEIQRINTTLEHGLIGPGLDAGPISDIRVRLTTHLRAAGKFPDFMEIGTAIFYAVYDWHIRYNQPIQITRISEQRFAIQFMFTQLIMRWEQDANYLGVPFDRG